MIDFSRNHFELFGLPERFQFDAALLDRAYHRLQGEVHPDQRVISGALLLLVMNFIGLGLGPTWVGAASDWFAARGTPHALQAALYTLTPFYLIAIALFHWLARTLRREEAAA